MPSARGRLGIRRQPELERGSRFLWHLHRLDCIRRSDYPAADQVADRGHAGQPNLERSAFARDISRDAQADQRQTVDGQVCQRTHL